MRNAVLLLLLIAPGMGFALQVSDPPKRLDPLPANQEKEKKAEAVRLYGAGLLYEKENRLLDALKAFEESIKLNPQAVAPRKAMIPIFLALDRIEEAMSACRFVLERDPESLETTLVYVQQLRALGRLKEVEELLEKLAKSPLAKEKHELKMRVLHDLALLQDTGDDGKKAEATGLELARVLEITAAEEILGLTETELRQEKAQNFERLGRLALKRGDTETAINRYLQSQKHDPVRAGRLGFNLAQVYAKNGKNEEALLRVDEFLKTQPLGTEGYALKIELQKKMGREKDILGELELASSRDTHNQPLKLLLAKELRSHGQVARAEAIYESVEFSAPGKEVYTALFEVYREGKDAGAEKALARLELAIQAAKRQGGIPPDPSQGQRVRSMMLALKTDPSLTRMIVKAALRRLENKQPLGLETKVALGTMAARLPDAAAAENLFQNSLEQTKGNPQSEHEVYSGLLRVLRLTHNHQRIIEVCKQGLTQAMATSRVLFHIELAGAYFHLEKDSDCLAAIDLAIQESQDREKLFCKRYRASMLGQMGKSDQAEKEVLALFADYQAPNEIRDIRYTLSGIYSHSKDHKKSEEQLLKVLEIDSADVTANNDLGYQWADRNLNLDAAERMIRKALDLDEKQRATSTQLLYEPESGAHIDSLGWVLFRQGKLPEALTLLIKASKLPDGEDDPVIWDHLGDVYFRLGKKEESLKCWRRAVDLYLVHRARRPEERVEDIKKKIQLQPTPGK